MKGIVFIVTAAAVFRCVLAQENVRKDNSGDVIESILEENADEQDLLPLEEELEYLRSHPVNIASAHYGDLLRVPGISPLLAEAILLYRDSVDIESTGQLLSVSLITPEMYEKILPFVTAEPRSDGNFLSGIVPESFDARGRTERRLQPVLGFRNGKFSGDRSSLYQRIRLGSRNFEAGGVLEKDAGEQYADGFAGGYLLVRNIPSIKKIIAGNYTVASDQGLVFAKNIAASKGINSVSQTRLRSGGIAPVISTDEFRYFRGAAATAGVDRFLVTGFYSDRNLHAAIDSSGVVTSFYSSGLFRTSSDLSKRSTVNENVIGGRLETTALWPVAISLNVLRIRYGKPLDPALYGLQTNHGVSAGSVGWSSATGRINTFGEIASNEGRRFSKVVGVNVPFSKTFSVAYHHRALGKGYVNPLARPFAERSNIAEGERGNYLGVHMALPQVEAASYVDFYSLPSAGAAFGTDGTDALLYVQYRVKGKFQISAQVRRKTKAQSGVGGADDERRQTNIRIGYSFDSGKQLSLAQRFETSSLEYLPSRYSEKGLLTFVEVKLQSRERGTFVKTRVIFFDTKSFDSRLYQYESDVAGNFSNPPLFGKGMRWYLVAGYDMAAGIRCSVKYAETKKFGDAVIGSGDDELVGNLDNTMAFQIDFSF